MKLPIVLPDLGVSRATLSVWFVAVGDLVYEGDLMLEIVLPGATFGLPAPVTGRVVERLALVHDTLTPGQVVGWIDELDPGFEDGTKH